MLYPIPPAAKRSGQFHASTLFAITLALLGGLIGAYLFKTYVMNGKSTAAVAAPTPAFTITVAAVNLTDKALILPTQVKTVSVSKEEYERITSNPKYLRGNQPVNRTTIKSIRAEDPIYDDYLEPSQYPLPVTLSLRPGKRAVIVEVPSKQVMVQIGDHVDVLCTLSNEAFGPGKTATAVIAKDLRVVARFNTTRTSAQPTNGDVTRTFTLEASPYRHELIELARTLGGSFTLSASARVAEGMGMVVGDMGVVDDDPKVDHVTAEDLRKVFGIPPRAPFVADAKPKNLEVERFSGVRRQSSLLFDVSTSTPVSPVPGKTVVPTAPTSQLPASASEPVVSAADSTADVNAGFSPPPTPKSLAGCPTCGKKKP